MTQMIAERKPTSDQIFGDNKAPAQEVLDADFADLKTETDELVQKAGALNRQVRSDADQAAVGNLIVELRALWKRADEIRATEKKPILDAGKELDGWFKTVLADAVKVGADLQKHADDFIRKQAAEAKAQAFRQAAAARDKAEAERAKADAAQTVKSASAAEARAEAKDAEAEQLEERTTAKSADLVRSRVGGVTSSAKGTWVARIVDYQAAITPLGTLGVFLKEDAIAAGLNSMAKTQKAGANWPGVTFSQEQKATFRR